MPHLIPLAGRGHASRYEATAYDWEGKSTGWRGSARPGRGGTACVDGLQLPADNDGYLVVRVVTRRSGRCPRCWSTWRGGRPAARPG